MGEYAQQLLESNEKSLSKQVWKHTGGKKIPLFIYMDSPNKITSHKYFVTDIALPGIYNNRILVRQLSQLWIFFVFQEKTVGCSFILAAWLRIPTAPLLWRALPRPERAPLGPARLDHR